MNKWESWPKAFEVAGKSNDGGGSQRLTLDLPPAEFAKALRELDRDREGISAGDSRYQAACALGELTWFDEMGRCVSILRHGSLVSKYEADGKERPPGPDPRLIATTLQAKENEEIRPQGGERIEMQTREGPVTLIALEESTSKGKIHIPPGLEDAEVRSVGYAGNVKLQAPVAWEGRDKDGQQVAGEAIVGGKAVALAPPMGAPLYPAGTMLTPDQATPRPGESPFEQFDRVAAQTGAVTVPEKPAPSIALAVKALLPKGKKK